MIEVKNVYLDYVKEYHTLNDISMNVDKGEFVVLFGEVDSGKSSLIRVISGIEPATKGEVYIKGININKLNYKTDISMGYISAKGNFYENRTVEYNLEYVLKIRKEMKEKIQSSVNSAMLKYGLKSLQDMKVKSLSRLDKMKLSIARLSLRKLDLIMVDDIFEGFSHKEAKELAELIKELIEINECTAVVAVSDSKLLKILDGRRVDIKFGSLEKKDA